MRPRSGLALIAASRLAALRCRRHPSSAPVCVYRVLRVMTPPAACQDRTGPFAPRMGDHLRQADRGAADEQGPLRACDGDPREDLNRRGLARAVRAEEGEDRSRRTWTSMPATASR